MTSHQPVRAKYPDHSSIYPYGHPSTGYNSPSSAQNSPIEPNFHSSSRLPPIHNLHHLRNVPESTMSYRLPQPTGNGSGLASMGIPQSRPNNHLSGGDHSGASTPTSYRPQNAVPGMPKKTQKEPDWYEFYKNGVPREVIVIHDSPDPPPGKSNATSQYNTRVADAEPMNKRRKTDFAQILHPAQPSKHDESSSGEPSSDRSNPSLQNTTAPTSIDTNGSGGVPDLSGASMAGGPSAGVKRKRTTRQVTQQEQQDQERARLQNQELLRKLQQQKEKDRQEYELKLQKELEDARREEKNKQLRQLRRQELAADSIPSRIHNYVPPTRPPKKAKEVQVEVIRYYTNPTNAAIDDSDGHYIVNDGSRLTERYEIIRQLGQGTFGKVVEAYDRTRDKRVAIKIIRAVQKYRDASKIELRVLHTLQLNDTDNKNKCIHLRHCFDFLNHICIVTDLYSQSVFDFLKSNSFIPFPNSQIQNFARQLLISVAFLHDLNLIHTDLKPENILLVNNAYQAFTYNREVPSATVNGKRTGRQRKVLINTDIRLIDFGSATFDDEYHSTVVSTRHYRAPEIILNLGWSFPCDIWSIGCILVEFFTGDALFQTHENVEHLAMMEKVLGEKVDGRLIKAVMAGGRSSSNPAHKYFNKARLAFPTTETTKQSKRYVACMKQIDDIIPTSTEWGNLFLDLLRKIFVYDPHKRITAKEALLHPWFRTSVIDDGTEAERIGQEKLIQAERRRRAEHAHYAASAASRGGVPLQVG